MHAEPFTVGETRTEAPRAAAIGLRPDGTPDDDDRVETGPTALAFAEWQALGIAAPDLARLREYRLGRVLGQLARRDCGGALLFDPINIRYATDASNMNVWVLHNPSRAAFVGVDGHVVLWDFERCTHLSAHLPLVRERRSGGAGFFYFLAGDAEQRIADAFAGELDEVLRAHGGGCRRLAVDRIEVAGLHALEGLGIEMCGGQRVMEHARLVKGADEIAAMRCAVASCEAAVRAMSGALRPGISEVELWAVLHAENIRRGGEWIETRLLSSGPRTNPWMQEAGPRRIREGDVVSCDTDLIGPYGMCVDISRSWLCGERAARGEQRTLHGLAREHIERNMALIAPGVAFRELTERGHRPPDPYYDQHYGVMMHGVGLCDEFPAIYYPEDHVPGAFDYLLEPGMTLCVEAYVGAPGGREGVKLEEQVLVTATGFERLSAVPFDERLGG